MFLDVILSILAPINILIMFIGVAVGIVIGALPGLNVVFAIAALLPITLGLDSTAGILLLLGSYCGATFGGSITAILINTPGTAANAATTIEGYALAKKGRAGDAIKTAVIGSFLGGVISCFALMFFAPALASVAVNFASQELFALAIFGLCAVIGIAGKEVLKGLIMASFGLLFAIVGIDPAEGVERLTFGNSNLLAGFNAVIILLGLFAMAEVILQCSIAKKEDKTQKIDIKYEKASIKFIDVLKHYKTIIRSSVIGIIIGAIPGTGGGISSWFSYNEARRARNKDDKDLPFGEGNIDGLIAAETGNNGATGSALIPLLTLGIPGDAATAVLLGALTMQDIIPGVGLFTSGNPWVYVIMGGLLVINFIMLAQGLVFSKLFANISKVPARILFPCIAFLAILGAFSISNSTFDVIVLVGFGLVGYVAKQLGFPMPPLVIGTILGSLVEVNLRRSLILSGGSYLTFFTDPVSCVILIVAILSLISPIISKVIAKNKKVETVEK